MSIVRMHRPPTAVSKKNANPHRGDQPENNEIWMDRQAGRSELRVYAPMIERMHARKIPKGSVDYPGR